MKKRIIKTSICVVTILALFLYLSFAFVTKELNPLQWEESERLMFVGIFAIFIIFGISLSAAAHGVSHSRFN